MLSRCKYLYYNLVYLHSWHCWWHLTRKLPILRRHSTKDGCVWPAVFVFDRRLQTMKHYQISTTFISKPDKYKNIERLPLRQSLEMPILVENGHSLQCSIEFLDRWTCNLPKWIKFQSGGQASVPEMSRNKRNEMMPYHYCSRSFHAFRHLMSTVARVVDIIS